MQYTIRNIPDYLDAVLRETAHKQGRSLNDMALMALTNGAGLDASMQKHRDLADVAGTWREDPEFNDAIAAQDQIDPSLWR
jgi:plasmid stability protein